MDFLSDSKSLAEFLGGLIVWIAVFVLYYYYLKNLSNLLKAVRTPNRKMQPGQVWPLMLNVLIFILPAARGYLYYYWPQSDLVAIIVQYSCFLFLVTWQLWVVYKVADSIEAEYDSREIPIERRPTFQTGMFMSVVRILTLLVFVPGISFVGPFFGLAYIGGLIAYWLRTRKFRKELQAMVTYNDDEDSLIFRDLHKE